MRRTERHIDWKRDDNRAEKALVRSLMDLLVEDMDESVFLGDPRTGQVRRPSDSELIVLIAGRELSIKIELHPERKTNDN